jgi:hypothetical protein
MMAVSRGRLLALSTPFGKRGWFYETWTDKERWQRERVTADMCPRIPKDFLEEERLALGPLWYDQEYFCAWQDAVGAVFLQSDIERAMSDGVRPLF